jgi:hypothetical protein
VTLSAAETKEPRDILFISFGGPHRMAFDGLKIVATANRAGQHFGKAVFLDIGTPARTV